MGRGSADPGGGVDAKGVPTSFGWQGQTYVVERLLRCWEVQTDWWTREGDVHSLFMSVITRTGLLCALFFDYTLAEWRITRLYA